MHWSSKELKDLFKAWLVISLAFAIATIGFSFSYKFLLAILFSSITVGSGFLLHEIAHKFFAQRFGCWAEFRSFDLALILALLLSFTGFVFAAPGAVFIRGRVSMSRNGVISLAGPLTNIILVLIFLAIGKIFPFLMQLSVYGSKINAWLALFNLIPFMPFDGSKVWMWNKLIWFLFAILALLSFLII